MLIVFCLLSLISASFGASNPGIVFNSQNGHYYQLVVPSVPVTYAAAAAEAGTRFHNSKQGYLVTITDAVEASFLLPIFQKKLYPWTESDQPAEVLYPTMWTGARRTGTKWNWHALTRTAQFYTTTTNTCDLPYCNWAPNMPSSDPAATHMQVYLYNAGGPAPGSWISVDPTTTSAAFVVEYDASTICTGGYYYNQATKWCEDVNECFSVSCGSGYSCTNVIGSYLCEDIDECALYPEAACPPGFTCSNLNGSYVCNDIDECAMNDTICAAGYKCRNTLGSYMCEDFNECTTSTDICPTGYLCTNTIGNYTCDDINECLFLMPCPAGSKCTNTIGSYTCDVQNVFIKNPHTGLVLDCDMAEGSRVFMATQIPGLARQLWRLVPNGYIEHVSTGYVLDIKGGIPSSGSHVIIYSKNPHYNYNQNWRYEAGDLNIVSAGNVVLDVYSASTAVGTGLIVWQKKSTNYQNQQFVLEGSAIS